MRQQHTLFSDLKTLKIKYWDFDESIQQGELIVHGCVAKEVLEIFDELFLEHFCIHKMCLIDVYGGDDLLSMAENNTSAFNYRTVAGEERLSQHSYGLAIDINPHQNPYINGAVVLPRQGELYRDRSLEHKGMIKASDVCYKAFISRGWIWGGDWTDKKDYHHFEKKIKGINE